MIWVILIIIAAIILIKFFSDREKLMQNVSKEGGMDEKYSILIGYLMDTNQAKITKLTRENVQIFVSSGFIDSHFSLLHTFRTLIVQWKGNSAMGDFTEKWEFPHFLNQHQMAEKIFRDIGFNIKNYGDNDELMRRINKTLDDMGEV